MFGTTLDHRKVVGGFPFWRVGFGDLSWVEMLKDFDPPDAAPPSAPKQFAVLSALGVALALIPVASSLVWYFFCIPFHEFGHAIGAWMGGFFAFPLGAFLPMAGVTFWHGTQSGAVILVWLGAWVLWTYSHLRIEGRLAVQLGILVLAASGTAMFLAGPYRQEELKVAGGILGEFLLPGLVIALYPERLHPKLFWGFFRVPLLVAAVAGGVRSAVLWLSVARSGALPMGSFLNGGSDPNGDLQRLTAEFGWAASTLPHRMLICGVAVGGVWVWSFAKLLRQKNDS